MRKTSLILVCALLMTLVPTNTFAIVDEWYPVGAPHEIPLEDTAKMTDEEFFGVWENEDFAVRGKINYNYSPDESDPSYQPLKSVEAYVKNSDYDGAKRELLQYFRDRKLAKKELAARNTTASDMALKWTFNFRDNYYDTFTITDSPSEVEVDITGLVQIGRENFMLAATDKSNSTAFFNTKENEEGKAPTLEVVVNGVTKTYTSYADTYVDFGNRGVVQGLRPDMRVCDSGLDVNRPFDENNTRAYFRFDLFSNPDPDMRIKEDDVITSATLRLYGYTNDESGNKKISLYDPESKNFDELTMTWDTTPVCLISWEGIPGGTDWADHQMDYNAHNQLANSTIRLPIIEQMLAEYYATYNEKYLKGVFGLLVDFCADYGAPGYIYPLSVGERCSTWDKVYPYLLESSYMTPELNTMLLKQIWIDTDYLHEEGNFFAFNNHGVTQTKGFLKMCVRFPEFSDVNEKWIELVQKRIDILTGRLVLDDGFYVECDTGYAVAVLETFCEYAEISAESGLELSDSFYNQIGRLGLSLLDCCWPNGIIQSIGDGGCGDVRGVYQKLAALFTELDNEQYVKWGEQFMWFATNGEGGSDDLNESHYYNKARIAIMRRGWSENDSLFAMINGGHEGGHNHRDKLNIDIFAYGRPLIKETGMASYSDLNPAYDYQKNTSRSHNVIEIDNYRAWDGALDKISVEMDSDMVINNGYDLFSGNHKLNSLVEDRDAKFITERNVLFVKNSGFYIVSDRVIPPDSKTHHYTQNWHLEPNIAAIKEDGTKRAYSKFSSGANIQIVPGNPEKVDVTLTDGYGINGNIQPVAVEDKHPQYIIDAEGTVTFDTILYPTNEGDMREVMSEGVETDAPQGEATAIRFDTDYPENGKIGTYFFRHGTSDETYSFGNYKTDAKMALVMNYPEGLITEMFLHGGKSLIANTEASAPCELIRSKSELTDICVEIYGTTMEISSSQDISHNTISIFAPGKIRDVIMNGIKIPFAKADNRIILNGIETTLEVIFNEKTNAYESTVAPEGITREAVTDSAVISAIFAGNTVISGESWNGNAKITAYENSNTLTAEFGDKHTSYTDKAVKIEIKGINVSDVRIGNQTLPKANYQDEEEAGKDLKTGEAKYQLTKNGVIIWTKVIDTLKLSKKSSNNESPKDYNGGSGGSGGFGGSGTVVPIVPGNDEKPEERPNDIKTFEDIKTHWAKNDIEFLAGKKLVNGVNETQFMPDNKITRAEFCAMLIRVLNVDIKAYGGEFKDVAPGDWFAGYVESASALKIANGYDGFFRPSDYITREEMAKMICNAYQTFSELPDTSSKVTFEDSESISPWAAGSVDTCANLGLLKGNESGMFLPRSNTTRAEAATVISRLYAHLDREAQIK